MSDNAEEGGGHSVGLWYVSFSDMITLLLSFFVMLTTFSSYSKASITKFNGAWAFIANYTVWPDHRGEDLMPPPTEQIDDSMEGSEKPTGLDPARVGNPREGFWDPSVGAYQERKVIYVASSRLFWGQGDNLIPAGREHLKLLASFLKLVPCQVVVGQSVPSGQNGGDSLARACTVVEFLQQQSSLDRERFSVSNLDDNVANRITGQPVIEILLLTKGIVD